MGATSRDGRVTRVDCATGRRARSMLACSRSFEQAGTEWPTLNSMRNIDVEVRMRIQGEDN